MIKQATSKKTSPIKQNKWNSGSFESIFKKASKTYYYSSLIFPKDIKDKVFRLYAFVRRADDYVDNIPQLKNEFFAFVQTYKNFRENIQVSELLQTNKPEDLDIIKSFVELEKECGFDLQWTDSFLNSMEQDTTNKEYVLMDQTLDYIYGSANVIGLFMCKIMNISPIAWKGAGLLGQAFQYINFIRDIKEDIALGRNYFPKTEMVKYNLTDFNEEFIMKYRKSEFIEFIKAQINYYYIWQEEAEQSFQYLPKNMLLAIKTASELYKWTAKEIEKNPLIVYSKKVKPNKRKILLIVFKNLVKI